MKQLMEFFKRLPDSVDKPWFPLGMALAAFSDYFIFIIPLDAIVAASFIASRKRWFRINVWTTLGSTLGAMVFAFFIQKYGIDFIHEWAPNLLNAPLAVKISVWIQEYGFWALLAIATIPINQHPTVAIAALANFSLSTLFLTLFLGRFIKYCIYAWLSLHARNGLKKFFRE